jgi:hypothetical protein
MHLNHEMDDYVEILPSPYLTLYSYLDSLTCWLVFVVKLGTPQDTRPDRSDERQKGDCERTKGEGEMCIPLSFVSNPSLIN